MEEGLFSIVCSNYNNAAFLKEMVQSVLDQTYTHWELIIIDDCSTDNSWEILLALQLDERIRLYRQSSNKGAASALNKGLELSRGEIIGRLDSDDKLSQKALEIMFSAHKKSPNASLICSTAFEWDGTKSADESNIWPNYRQPTQSLIHECTVGHFATWKSQCIGHIPFVDEDLLKAVDFDLYLKLEELGDIEFINEPLYYYRIHDGGISQATSGIHAYHFSILVRHRAFFRRKGTTLPNLSKQKHNHMMRKWYLREIRLKKDSSGLKASTTLFQAIFAHPSLIWSRTLWSILLKPDRK